MLYIYVTELFVSPFSFRNILQFGQLNLFIEVYKIMAINFVGRHLIFLPSAKYSDVVVIIFSTVIVMRRGAVGGEKTCVSLKVLLNILKAKTI